MKVLSALGQLLGKKAEEDPAVKDGLYALATQEVGDGTLVQTDNPRWWETTLQAIYKVRFTDALGNPNSINDQFVPPVVLIDRNNVPVGRIQDGDEVIFFNFRTDRPKALTSCFVQTHQLYEGLVSGLSERAKRSLNLWVTTLTAYDDAFSELAHVAFSPEPLSHTYDEFLISKGLRVARFMESQKWRAGTWFLDGRRLIGKIMEGLGLRPLPAEVHPTWRKEMWARPDTTEPAMSVTVVESPKIAYDQAPQMSAKELTGRILEEVRNPQGAEDIFVNYANADMVAHAATDPTKFEAVVHAIATLNHELGRLVPEAIKQGYIVAITADHGNAEEMLDMAGKAKPAHTTNRIPFILAGIPHDAVTLRDDGTLADAAPTFLELRELTSPPEMDRKSLVVKKENVPAQKKILRIILDGWGIRKEEKGNAILAAQKRIEAQGGTFWLAKWTTEYASTTLEASGEKSGYPKGAEGTTEFGHVLFGAGRSVAADVTRINQALTDGSFVNNAELLAAIQYAKQNNTNLHLIGIVTKQRVVVHVSFDHLLAILKMAKTAGLRSDQVKIHAITDGRDVEGQSAIEYLGNLQDELEKIGIGQIVTIVGREWALNRDNRWDLVEPAYRALVEGTGGLHVNPSR